MLEAYLKPCRRLSRLTFFIAFFIIISASFMRQVMSFARDSLGQEIFKVILALVLAGPALAFLIFALKSRKSFIRIASLVIMLGLGLVLSWQMKIPEERAHLLEYAVLGWFSVRDFNRKSKIFKGAVFAFLFTVAVGILDEVFQLFLPYRVYDVRDIAFNGLGGAWGIILYLTYAFKRKN